MSLSLDQNRLIWTSLSALSIILGVNLKNSVKFLKKDKQPVVGWLDALSTPLGIALFVGGWFGIAYNTIKANDDTGLVNQTLIGASVVGIVVGVMFQQMVSEQSPLGAVKPWVMGIGFIGGWLLLGITAGLGRSLSRTVMIRKEDGSDDDDDFEKSTLNQTSLALTLPAALLVLASMTSILPLQRGDKDLLGNTWTTPDAKIVDGPGYPMFVIAWALITLSNALSIKSKLPPSALVRL